MAALWLALLLLLPAACGPARGGRDGSAEAGSIESRTEEIARAFAADGDGTLARAALQSLDVANPTQWLVYMAENAVTNPSSDPETTRALVALALELGSRESTIRTWAEANGLIEVAQATSAVEAATLAAAVQEPVATAAQSLAAEAARAGAPVSVTAPLTAAPGVLAAADPAAPPAQNAAATPTPTTAPSATPAARPLASATELLNLRQGPGTEYTLVGSLAPGEAAEITGKNAAGDWWQVRTSGGASAWVYGPLVTTSGPVDAIALAADIPAAPTAAPTATPAPAPPAAAPPADPAPQPTAAPPADPPADPPAAPPADPAAQPTEAPAPPADPGAAPHFTKIMSRMWSKQENGDCQGQHLLRITVLDANGAPLNGITLQGIYTGMTLVTGDQGKGDGRIEFDLYGTGEGFVVVRNNDGREATSDRAEGFTTKSLDIPVPVLIEGGYCSDDTTCQVFYNSYGCTGHHSWEAVFKRNY